MKFRKKPIIIDAEQWFPEKNEKYFIDTLEGIMEVSPGDWVITGIKGEKYPCKPDIFEQTYEAISF